MTLPEPSKTRSISDVAAGSGMEVLPLPNHIFQQLLLLYVIKCKFSSDIRWLHRELRCGVQQIIEYFLNS